MNLAPGAKSVPSGIVSLPVNAPLSSPVGGGGVSVGVVEVTAGVDGEMVAVSTGEGVICASWVAAACVAAIAVVSKVGNGGLVGVCDPAWLRRASAVWAAAVFTASGDSALEVEVAFEDFLQAVSKNANKIMQVNNRFKGFVTFIFLNMRAP